MDLIWLKRIKKNLQFLTYLFSFETDKFVETLSVKAVKPGSRRYPAQPLGNAEHFPYPQNRHGVNGRTPERSNVPALAKVATCNGSPQNCIQVSLTELIPFPLGVIFYLGFIDKHRNDNEGGSHQPHCGINHGVQGWGPAQLCGMGWLSLVPQCPHRSLRTGDVPDSRRAHRVKAEHKQAQRYPRNTSG